MKRTLLLLEHSSRIQICCFETELTHAYNSNVSQMVVSFITPDGRASEQSIESGIHCFYKPLESDGILNL